LSLYKRCSVNEFAALYLSAENYRTEAEIATRPCECIHRCGDVCKCFNTLKDARAASTMTPAKATVPDRACELTNDIEGFEMWVDRFRRQAVAAIRDRSVQGDEAAVERGRKWFLVICERGIEAAERVGNHAYAAMLQRQREKFYRALSDQAAPPPEESGLLPLPPVDSDAAVRTMPAHELFVGFFLECAAGGLSFYEALDSLRRPTATPRPDRS
jgi:hypothetical protein